ADVGYAELAQRGVQLTHFGQQALDRFVLADFVRDVFLLQLAQFFTGQLFAALLFSFFNGLGVGFLVLSVGLAVVLHHGLVFFVGLFDLGLLGVGQVAAHAAAGSDTVAHQAVQLAVAVEVRDVDAQAAAGAELVLAR